MCLLELLLGAWSPPPVLSVCIIPDQSSWKSYVHMTCLYMTIFLEWSLCLFSNWQHAAECPPPGSILPGTFHKASSIWIVLSAKFWKASSIWMFPMWNFCMHGILNVTLSGNFSKAFQSNCNLPGNFHSSGSICPTSLRPTCLIVTYLATSIK